MMNYTIYDAATGQIQSLFTCNDETTAQLNLQGCSYIVGHYSAQQYYIHNQQPQSKGVPPSDDHVFDYGSKTWTIDIHKIALDVRQTRNNLLETIDKINPVWYASLTQQQQQELKTYRQALLDVPQQAGFPTAIEWPAKPAWL